jgi:2-dehydro-3-deoxygalactonokinase
MTFFSCDWGTSNFRLRLVDYQNQKVLSEVKTGYGISSAFAEWKQTGGIASNRIRFYQTYIQEQVKNLSNSLNQTLSDIPIILSGMASSSIGMLELPYKEIPFKCDGSDLYTHILEPGDHLSTMIIISGVRSDVDVIRGEETMLAGCMITDDKSDQLFIFPGTHSKHLRVKNAVAYQFATYMTGELFDLLSNRSILSASVKKDNIKNSLDGQAFTEGVLKGASSNLLNCIFHVRTNQLFTKLPPEKNYDYLSGLLVGHELKDLISNHTGAITLVCSDQIKEIYLKAIAILGFADHVHYQNADETLIKGQARIMQHNGYSARN